MGEIFLIAATLKLFGVEVHICISVQLLLENTLLPVAFAGHVCLNLATRSRPEVSFSHTSVLTESLFHVKE